MASPHPCDHGMLSPPSAFLVEANFSLQHQFTPSCKVQKLSFEFDATCTVSAFSFVQGHDLFSFCATNDCCLLVSRTLPVFPSNVLLWVGVVFRARVLSLVGVMFGPILGRMSSGVFIFYDCRVESRLMTIAHPLTRPVLAFSAVACRALICFSFLLVSSILFTAQGGKSVYLCTLSFV